MHRSASEPSFCADRLRLLSTCRRLCQIRAATHPPKQMCQGTDHPQNWASPEHSVNTGNNVFDFSDVAPEKSNTLLPVFTEAWFALLFVAFEAESAALSPPL